MDGLVSGRPIHSIWIGTHGRWTFYESVDCEIACTRYFGADVERVREGPIDLEWVAPNRLRVRVADGAIDWNVTIGSTVATRMMSTMGSVMPLAAWRSGPVFNAMGAVAGRVLGVGKVQLTGTTSNRQHFDANPLRIWYVTASNAVVEGEDLGPIGPLSEQAHIADFFFPQRGIRGCRVFISPHQTNSRGAPTATVPR